jgi:hypothetical protein
MATHECPACGECFGYCQMCGEITSEDLDGVHNDDTGEWLCVNCKGEEQ